MLPCTIRPPRHNVSSTSTLLTLDPAGTALRHSPCPPASESLYIGAAALAAILLLASLL